ncbi:MAG TPA: selenide, water dikinase SelD [Burkholderiales bacterium]|nr:selenide, water dikinase SelD [Burkholderiales bacterium]
MSNIRLTQLSHGGGCGCKIAPDRLASLLAGLPSRFVPPELLVGIQSSDDAAVYQINPSQAIVATTDFFLPIVDDPEDFGAIAAANALSDIYAMGATPIFALAIVGMPVDVLPEKIITSILRGGETICNRAGIPIAGGHTIDSKEPFYGLVVIGLVHPKNLKRNDTSRPNDLLMLGKPIGIGILGAALKQGKLDESGYDSLRRTATMLNIPGKELAQIEGIHAMTDVTGFGLIGHLLELCRGANLAAEISYSSIPLLPKVEAYIRSGIVTGASGRNLNACANEVEFSSGILSWQRDLLADPQTSGGLLLAIEESAKADAEEIFRTHGFTQVSIIGRMQEGNPRLYILP